MSSSFSHAPTGDPCDDLARLFLDHDDPTPADDEIIPPVHVAAAPAPPLTPRSEVPSFAMQVPNPTPPSRPTTRPGPSLVSASPVPTPVMRTLDPEPLDPGVDPAILRPRFRSDMPATIAPEPNAPETVDVLLAGHLPRPAAMWGHQAVGAIARREGPVALVQADGDFSANLRLFQATREITNKEIERGGPTDTLRQAYTNLERFHPRWMIGLQDAAEVVDLFNLPVRRVVYITCADRLAMVGAYRAIKKVRAMTGETAEISIIVVGESDERARTVHQRLAAVADRFLNQRVDLLAVVPRISPICGMDIGRYNIDGDFSDWVDTHLGFDDDVSASDPLRLGDVKIEPLDEHEQAALIRPLLPKHVVEHDQDTTETHTVAQPASTMPERIVSHATSSTPPPPAPLPALDAPTAAAASAVASEPVTAPVTPRVSPAVRDDKPDLSSLLDGVARIPVTCPWSSTVEFGIDRHGVVHAMMTDHNSDDATVADLQAACEWAVQHADIIGRISPRVTPDALAHIETHLFTRHPKAQRRWLFSPNLRVHLLTSVRELRESEQAWVHVELN